MSDDSSPIPADLEDRLREEPDEVHDDLHSVWALIGAAEETAREEADPEAAWAALTQRRPELKPTPDDGASTATSAASDHGSRRHRRSAQRPRRRQWRVAVGLALAALVLVGGLWLWRQPVTVTAPPGERRTATLPDGSTVELNSGTTVAYRRGFQAWPLIADDHRRLQLDGEAFFEVAEGSRPFTVETQNAQVTVLGTRFNVRARPGPGRASETEVTVVDGRVRLASQKQPNEGVLLSERGQVSRVTSPAAAPTSPQSTSIKHVLAWRENGFAARAQPLTAVLRDLERHYDAVLHLHDSVARPEAPISLYYPEPTTLETILHDLCTARGLNYRETSRGFEIFKASDAR